MSKTVKVIIIILCLLILIAAVFSVMYFTIQKQVKDKDGMKKYKK